MMLLHEIAQNKRNLGQTDQRHAEMKNQAKIRAISMIKNHSEISTFIPLNIFKERSIKLSRKWALVTIAIDITNL